jgi:hypothetical protein
MPTAELTAIVTLLVSLSVASERLVEIIKSTFFPAWSKEIVAAAGAAADEIGAAEKLEARRKAKIQFLAVLSGIGTAFLAKPAIDSYSSILHLKDGTGWAVIVAFGFLASGGSGFWNSILGYLLKVKDVKEAESKLSPVSAQRAVAETEKAKADAEKAKAEADQAKNTNS